MGRNREDIIKDGESTRFQSADGSEEKMGKKVFGLVFPIAYEQQLSLLSQGERIALMRSSIIAELERKKAD